MPQPDRMLRAFESLSKNKNLDKIKIYNAGVGGNLNCFQRVVFENCFYE